MLKLLRVLFGWRYIMTVREACAFVGLRFANGPSSCTHGSCENLFQGPDRKLGRKAELGDPVSCSSAVEISQAFFRTRAEESKGPDSIDDLQLFIRDILLPQLKLLEFGGNVGSIDLWTNLNRVDEWVVNEAARDWPRWRDVTFPVFLASPNGQSLVRVVKEIVTQWKLVSLLDLERNHAIVEVARFYFRFASLTGIDDLEEPFLVFLSESIDQNPPRTRGEEGWLNVPTDSVSLLKVSDEIEELSSPSEEGSVLLMEMTRVALLISQWAPSSSQALLENQIITSLCPNLVDLFTEVNADIIEKAHLIRLGVTFVDFCKRSLPVEDLTPGRYALASVVHPHTFGLENRMDLSWIRETELQMPWVRELDQRLSAIERKGMTAAMLRATLNTVGQLRQVRTSRFNRIVFAGKTDTEARTLGRGMGLALLHGAHIRAWTLDPKLARLLHPHGRKQMSSLDDIARALGANRSRKRMKILKDFFAMTAGIDDVMHPGGYELFTLAKWMERFGPHGTYF